MRVIRAWFVRFRSLFARDDDDLQAEIDSHLQMHVDDNVRAGMSGDEARRVARIRLGGMEGLKENYRDRRGVPFVSHLAQDLRFAVRLLRRTPTFTAVVVLTLALGIGANTAVFSVVDAVLLRPLPYPESDRLMLLWATESKRGVSTDVASYPDFETWRARSHSFDGMAAFTNRGVTLEGRDGSVLASALQATPGFFETLGVRPALGRTFQEADVTSGHGHVAILSDTFWRHEFGARSDVVGQTIRANEEIYTIVGVMPEGFSFADGRTPQIYTPILRDPNRNHGFLRVVGRLKPGVRRAVAQAEMDAVSLALAREFPRSNATVGVNVMPLIDAFVGNARIGLLMFLGVVALVLLIACTNVANLMLARNAHRERELAVRAAVGAGRWRLTQQLLTESIVLSIVGGALGMAVASWSTRGLVVLLSRMAYIPRLESAGSDARVLGFTLAVSLATGVLFGLVPAILAAPARLTDTLREGSRATTGVTSARARACLMIAETALALVLLAGAGMLLKHLLVLRSTAPGFNSEQLLAVELRLPKKKFAADVDRAQLFTDVLSRVRMVSGVGSAALVANLPLNNDSDTLGFKIPGRSDTKSLSANFNIASAGYFRTMQIPLRAGREFDDRDRDGTPPVIVINEAAARKFWPGEAAVGKQILLPTSQTANVTLTVVGVTGDVRQMGLGVGARPEIFLSAAQPGPGWPWMALVVRTNVEPIGIAGAVKAATHAADRDVAVNRVRTVDDVMAESLAQPQVYTLLLATFATLALVLAAVGLYGVVSYSVAQRTHEIGIRMALGARRGDVVRMVLRYGASYVLAGTLVGLAGAVGFMRLLMQLMPGAQAGDWGTLASVALLLLIVAVAASYLPARRGSRVDPIVALRAD